MKKLFAILTILSVICVYLPTNAEEEKKVTAYKNFNFVDCDRYVDTGNSNPMIFFSEYIGAIWPGDYVVFENLDFGNASPSKFEMTIGTTKEYVGTFEVRADSEKGDLLATVNVEPSSWTTAKSHIANIEKEIVGVHDIYIVNTHNTGNIYTCKFIKGADKSIGAFEYEDNYIFDDVSDNRYKYQIRSVGSLGLMSAYVNNNFEPGLPVTRGEAAVIIYNIFGEEHEAEQVFKDVTKENEIIATNYLCSRGIISKTENYRPIEFITVNEMVTMLVRVLGYEKYATQTGGYPLGYLKVAREQNLLSGIENEGVVRRDTLAAMIYNMINANYMEVTSVSDGEAEYGEKKGILSKVKKVYKGKGIVAANRYTGLNYADINVGNNQVIIGDDIFDVTGTKATNLIGVNCEYFYSEDENGNNKIISIYPYRTVSQLVIATDNEEILDIDASKLTYRDENGKIINVRLVSGAKIIYNGKAIERMFEANGFRGKIRLVDNGDGYETVIVDSYRNITIGSINTYSAEIYDSDGDLVLSYDEDDGETYFYKDGVPIVVESDDVRPGDSAMVYVSENSVGQKLTRVVLSNNKVYGTIESISENKAIINQIPYTIPVETSSEIKVNLSGIFTINDYEEIVNFESMAIENISIGCILDYRKTDNGINNNAEVKLLTKDKGVSVFSAAKNFILDGEKVTTSSQMAENLKDLELRSAVRYLLNEKDEIIMLDTYIENKNNANDTMRRLSEREEGYRYVSEMLILNGVAIYPIASNADTICFSAYYEDDEKAYFSVMSNRKSSNEIMSGNAYASDGNMLVADVFVRTNADTAHEVEKPMVVEKLSKKLDKNGEIETIICGYIGSVYTEYEVDYGWEKSDAKVELLIQGLQRGDVIKAGLNEKGKVAKCTPIYLCDGKSSINGNGVYIHDDLVGGSVGDYRQDDNFTLGVVTARDKNVAKLARKSKEDGTEYTASCYLNNASVVIVDKTVSPCKIKTGLGGSAVSVGDKVLVWNSSARANMIVIYQE